MTASFLDECRTLARSPRFHDLVIGLIVVNAVVIGLETVPSVMAGAGHWVRAAEEVLGLFFVLEITLRVAAEWPTPLRFLRGGWNVFDAVVVGASLLPQVGSFATVARLARVLRVTRLVSSVPELRLIVATMLRSVRSMGHIALLLGLLLYVYGVLGYHLFSAVDPAHWGSLGAAIGTLFQILTLEGWVEIQARSQAAVPLAWLFYGSFIVVAVFVVINLFIAVVINNLESTREDEKRRSDDASGDAVLREAVALRERIESLEALLRRSRAA
jgi:voltage-gated sodium channel